jgi:hypothetical protein
MSAGSQLAIRSGRRIRQFVDFGREQEGMVAPRGGRRPRVFLGRVPAWVSAGRWGPRRVRVEECAAMLPAELVYDRLLRDNVAIGPGWRAELRWTPTGLDGRRWSIYAEVRANAVWRRGRLFLCCPACLGRATRLYIPAADADPRCRRCWGLTYTSRSWSYAPVFMFGQWLESAATATTYESRRERKANSRKRYALRRQSVSTAADATDDSAQ